MEDICEIRIFDNDLNWISETHLAESVQFTRELYDTGKFEIHINPDKKNAFRLAKNGTVIMINGDPNKSGIVKDFYISESRTKSDLVIYGETANTLTKRRITVPPSKAQNPSALGWDKVHANAEHVIKHYVRQNLTKTYNAKRMMRKLTIAENKMRGKIFPWKSRYIQLSTELTNIAMYGDMGYLIYLDVPHKQWVFDVIVGMDRTKRQNIVSPVVFKMEYQNVDGYKFIEDYTRYRTTGYAGGTGEDENRLVYILGDEKEDEQRYEEFLDCASAEHIDELIYYAEQKMVEFTETKTIEVGALPKVFEFEKDYFLGDKVTVIVSKLDLEIDTKITSVKEVWERGKGHVQELRFGDKVPNIFNIMNKKNEVK